jgi:hypothetical protein
MNRILSIAVAGVSGLALGLVSTSSVSPDASRGRALDRAAGNSSPCTGGPYG